MARILRRTVTVDGTAYPAGSSPPAAVAKRISNPRAWEPVEAVTEEASPPETLPGDAPAADVLTNNADVVITFAEANPARAQELLDAETGGEDRKGVKAALSKLLE